MKPNGLVRIQFCTSNSTHAKMWGPVVAALRQKNNLQVIEILSLNSYYNRLPPPLFENLNADSVYTLERYWSKGSYWELVGLKKLFLVVEAVFRLCLRYIRIRPDIVIMGNDIGVIEVALIKIASLMKIPTILIQDGILNGNLRRRNIAHPNIKSIIKLLVFKLLGIWESPTYGHGGTDAVAVMGQYTYDLLQNEERDMTHVFITGQPRFDDYPPKEQDDMTDNYAVSIRHKYKISNSSYVISFFSQPFITYKLMKPEQWDHVIEMMFLAIRDVMVEKDCFIFVKLHPAERLSDFASRYSHYIDLFDSRIILDDKADLQEIIKMTDLVIVNSSTVSLEAILFNKPVVLLDPYEFFDDYKFVGMGAAVHAASKEDLKEKIELLMESGTSSEMKDARSLAIDYHVWKFGEPASPRVANLILRFLGLGDN